MPEIRNPNLQTPGTPGGSGGGGDMRSTMAFFVLMLAVLFGYQYFFKPKTAPIAPTQTQTQTQSQAPQAGTAPSQTQWAPAGAQASGTAPSIVATSETETTVENELYKIVFTNRGAQVKSWILKSYKDTTGKPLDMVQPQTAARFGLPLSFYTYEPALTAQLNQVLYQASATGTLLAPNSLTFHYAAYGLDVVKTLHFDSSYVISIDTEVKRNGSPVRALVQWPAGLGDMEEFRPGKAPTGSILTASQFAWLIDGKSDQQVAAKVGGNATLNEPYQYAGISDLYFAAAFLPSVPSDASVVTLHNTIELPGDLSDPSSTKKPANVIGLAVGDQSGSNSLRLYAGPKQMDVLNTIHSIGSDGKADGPTLEPLIHYGWLGIVAKPLYIALRFLHGLLGTGINNWGWAIIIFTATFNLIMLPTRFVMMKSSIKMARIQPKVDAIRKKYAHLKMNDPKRADMNAEIMALHQAEGINMVGGCLPLLVQMPLFIAYFEVLSNVIELRQAHWFWLTDLSLPDPFHVLPILIILSMFLTQFITPSPGMDPAQRRMMAFMMPVFFGFILWHYASGLALYWGTSNLINLSFQLIINNTKDGKELHAIAARKAAKKLGSGRGDQRTIQGRR